MIVLEKYGFPFCSHRGFPVTCDDVISFIPDVGSYTARKVFFNSETNIENLTFVQNKQELEREKKKEQID
jgi:hypothetical protein